MEDYLIVKTKITSPKLGKNILKRPRLLNLLRNNLDKKLILVSADAGYGKTTLISDLASEIERHRKAWYTIDKGDADLVVFMSYLVESIAQAYPNFGNKTKIIIKNVKDLSANLEIVVGAFINELMDTLKDELFIFIDDYHLVSESKSINDALDYLLEHQPQKLHLIISTRTLPTIRLAKLSSKQELFMLKKEDLQFTQEEVKALFKDIYHTEVPDVELSKFEEYTKGWITALQLISQELSYKGANEVIPIYRDSKVGEKVFKYFANEIIQKLPDKMQSFLLKSSILETMEPELLNNVLGISNSTEMLDSIVKLNLFISIIPGEKKVFKYHPIFREFLMHRLIDTFGKKLVDSLHRKAGTYFIKAGDIENAIPHYLNSADYEKAADSIEKVAGNMIDKGKLVTVNDWINNLPSDLIDNFPRLLMEKGSLLYCLGELDEAMHIFKKAEKLFRERDDKRGTSRALQAIGMVTINRGDANEGLEIEKNALHLASPKAYSLRAYILNDISRAQRRLGKYKEAIKSLTEALSLCKKTEDMSLKIIVLHNLGLIYQSQGDFTHAEQSYKEVIETCSKTPFPWIGTTYNNMAILSLEKGDLTQCKRWLEMSIQICKEFNDKRGLLYTYIIMGEMLAETGDHELAMEKYQEALALNTKLKEKETESECLENIAKLYLLQGDYYRAKQYINKALKTIEKSSKSLRIARVLLTQGKIEIATGAFKEAEVTLLKSLPIIENLGANYDLMQVYFWLSQLYFKKSILHEEQKLKHYIKEALNLASKYEYDHFLIKNCKHNFSLLEFAIRHKIEPRYAIFVLSQIGTSAFETLTSLFELKDESIQRWVIEGVVNIGDERALTWLEKLNKEEYPSLKEDISQAINKLQKVKRVPMVEAIHELPLHKEVEVKYRFENIVGRHPKMQEVYNLLEKVIDTDATVLIQGETGTGKELVARAIHYNGKRKDKKFIAIACGALPETLLESELFGYVKGAFTGAVGTKKGLFEEADGGTLFLDDVTNLTPGIQAKLLRVLEDKEIRPVGGLSSKKVDVRIITSTNKDLEKEVKEGKFRNDLYYRLAVVTIEVPPLRERKSDIPLLAQHFIRKYSKAMNKNIKGFEKEAIDLLLSYNWPGNVRELEHEIEQMVIFTDTDIITKEMLSTKPFSIFIGDKQAMLLGGGIKGFSLKETKKEAEKLAGIAYIRDTLLKYNWNVTYAAKKLGISRRHLHRLLGKYHIERKPHLKINKTNT
ncbi:MAG: sigma 54-interacting transcriptional regulator [bacterium]|nr:sigma 54-interacting transcriptional regulator [bacterium]